MKKQIQRNRSLTLNAETIRILLRHELSVAAGGAKPTAAGSGCYTCDDTCTSCVRSCPP